MKNLITVLFILMSLQIFYAQKNEIRFGKIGKAEIIYNECPFDKEAEAVVLYDKGFSCFSDQKRSYWIIFNRTTRIKVLKDAGIKWAEIEIPYYQSDKIQEEIYDIKANSFIYENGQIIKTELDLKNSYDEKLNENWMLKKFAIPNVKKGTIIEYTYKVESPYLFNLRDWEFQWEIPVIYSEYDVRLIPRFQYIFNLQGATKFDEYSTEKLVSVDLYANQRGYNDMLHKFIMKNVPAFKNEEFITSKKDLITKLDFQLSKVSFNSGDFKNVFSSWSDLIVGLIKKDEFGKYMSNCEKLGSKILNIDSVSTLSSIQKFDSIINFVKSKYSWNKTYGKFSTKTPENLLNDKFGNSAEINLFTIGLLNSVGIKASPVLISTRENGRINMDYPFINSFNNVIIQAEIDNEVILSDATDLNLANNRLPTTCMNEVGLVIKKDILKWVNLQTTIPTKTTTNLFVNLTDSLSYAKIIINANEYDGFYFREKYGKDISKLSKSLANNDYNPSDSTIEIKNSGNLSDSYRMKFTTAFQPEKLKDKIYVSPFFNEVPKNNPLKQLTRTYPIDMVYPQKKTFVSKVSIPKGYKVSYIPQDQKIKTDKFEMDYKVDSFNENLIISFYYYFKLAKYAPNDYLNLKTFYSEIIEKANEKISFVKL